MLNKLRVFFGVEYKEGIRYWIPIKDIKIFAEFQNHKPNKFKINAKKIAYEKTGYLDPIVLNLNFELVDGYCSYLILKKYDLKKIPVYFSYDTNNIK